MSSEKSRSQSFNNLCVSVLIDTLTFQFVLAYFPSALCLRLTYLSESHYLLPITCLYQFPNLITSLTRLSYYITLLSFPTAFSFFPCCRRRRPIYSLKCFCSLIFRSQNKPVASPKHSWPGWRGPVHLAAGGRCGCRCAKRNVPKSLTVHGITAFLFSSWNVHTHFPLPQVFS